MQSLCRMNLFLIAPEEEEVAWNWSQDVIALSVEEIAQPIENLAEPMPYTVEKASTMMQAQMPQDLRTRCLSSLSQSLWWKQSWRGRRESEATMTNFKCLDRSICQQPLQRNVPHWFFRHWPLLQASWSRMATFLILTRVYIAVALALTVSVSVFIGWCAQHLLQIGRAQRHEISVHFLTISICLSPGLTSYCFYPFLMPATFKFVIIGQS